MHIHCPTLNLELSLLLHPLRFFDPENWEPLNKRLQQWLHDGNALQLQSAVPFDELSETLRVCYYGNINGILQWQLLTTQQQLAAAQKQFEAAAACRDQLQQLREQYQTISGAPVLPFFAQDKRVLTLRLTGNECVDQQIRNRLGLAESAPAPAPPPAPEAPEKEEHPPVKKWIARADTTLIYTTGSGDNLRIAIPKGTVLEGWVGSKFTYKHRIRTLELTAPLQYTPEYLGANFLFFPEEVEECKQEP